MFDGEIVEKKFPFQKILDFKNFWSKTESKIRSKTKLYSENFHQNFFFSFLQKALNWD